MTHMFGSVLFAADDLLWIPKKNIKTQNVFLKVIVWEWRTMQIRKFSSWNILNFHENIKEDNSDSSRVILRQILLLISTARYQYIT